ncbi:transporter substrate-binding domain-containing protein [Marivivens sp.]|nr:transporter substrate-binding domain-containing protein [Marivivens sp.]
MIKCRSALARSILAIAFAIGSVNFANARCEDYAPSARPQNTARDYVGADLDTIVERGWIEFAVYEDLPPYSWKDGAEDRGVDVEIARLIAEALGVEPRFKYVTSGENVEADLRN